MSSLKFTKYDCANQRSIVGGTGERQSKKTLKKRSNESVHNASKNKQTLNCFKNL